MTDTIYAREPDYRHVFDLALERGFILRRVAEGLISDIGDVFLLFENLEAPDGWCWGPVACWSFDLAKVERFLLEDEDEDAHDEYTLGEAIEHAQNMLAVGPTQEVTLRLSEQGGRHRVSGGRPRPDTQRGRRGGAARLRAVGDVAGDR